ncbi:hypothetical protein NQZ68_004243 [Dissostichus eleginoides]|nr:hypothetical protein NQZ68_004243 [Dissostichus eleginoides]
MGHFVLHSNKPPKRLHTHDPQRSGPDLQIPQRATAGEDVIFSRLYLSLRPGGEGPGHPSMSQSKTGCNLECNKNTAHPLPPRYNSTSTHHPEACFQSIPERGLDCELRMRF